MLRSRKLHLIALALLSSATVALFFALVPPLGQDTAYHLFADGRRLWGIPNLLNVASNCPFLAVGLLGLILDAKGRLVHDNTKNFPFYSVFFSGVALTGLGSSYYHLSPENSTLVWDRLPMTISFAALTVAVISEHVEQGIERWLLYPSISIGLLSVITWYSSELQGHGDLRLYALVQFLPMFMIPIICIFFQSRFSRHRDIVVALAFYVLAKVAEHFDAALFSFTGAISGHTLKHLLAALGTFWILRMLRLRERVRTNGGNSLAQKTAPDNPID